MSTSQAQQEANKANAQLSTGPTSAEGKAKVSLNAVKTGLTGRTVLLPADDVAAYEALIAELTQKWQPVDAEEQRLTQALVDTEWRMLRIPELESGILALGYRELAHEFDDIEDLAARRCAISAKVYLTYIRKLNNLQTQEARLYRQREKDNAALRELQAARQLDRSKKLDIAARLYTKAVAAGTNQAWQPQNFGFEFSIEEIEMRAFTLNPDLFDSWDGTGGEELEEDEEQEVLAA